MKRISSNERFWSKVEKTKTCWIWKGQRICNYGRFSYKSKGIGAHRFSWFLAYGKWPENHICHKCDNPPCVRPDHLFDGTHAENHKDKKDKMTARRLEYIKRMLEAGLINNNVFSFPKREKIIHKHRQSVNKKIVLYLYEQGVRQAEIARTFKISRQRIGKIIHV